MTGAVDADERRAKPSTDDPDVRSLRERVRANPRPALIWVGVAAVLLALEFARVMAGVLAGGNALFYGIGLVAGIPSWIGGNVGTALGDVPGSIAFDLVTLTLLAGLAVVLRAFQPWRLENVFDRDLGQRTWYRLELVVITAVLAGAAFLVAYTPVGAFVADELTFWARGVETLSNLPTLTSRELIPNMGHRLPGGGWDGTFLGLSPRIAWLLRFLLVWVYAALVVVWVWKGYNVYRDHYREADWTPRDDTVRRFRNHSWGLLGLAVVLGFLTLAVFAPAVSPVPYEHNIVEPFNHEFEYLENGEVEEILHGNANLQSQSDGQTTIGPNSYDDYGRYAPLGTTPGGEDMLTHLAYGARTSLIISLTAVLIGAIVAIVLSLMSAYYKGVFDLAVVLASDTIISVPVLIMAMMIVVIFQEGNHPLAQPLDGGLLLAVVLGIAYWPGMWRSIRGPSLQVAEKEWVDAAKSYGQKPIQIMRKHMAPFIASYIIIYASLLIGGIIITVAALSFLGLGINPPTPEWGRLINEGRPFIATGSWHVSTIAGLMIALVVLAFNALGDAVRDAIDPEADVGDEAVGAGGGG